MKELEAQVAWQRAGQVFPDAIHHAAHGRCRIASSLKTAIAVEQAR